MAANSATTKTLWRCWMLQQQQHHRRSSLSYLSTAAARSERSTTMVKPANLKIDPRSTCSPFYGMKRIPKETKLSPASVAAEKTTTEEAGDQEEEKMTLEAQQEDVDDQDNLEEHEDYDDDDDVDEYQFDEEIWYDTTSATKSKTSKNNHYHKNRRLVVPLPDRLLVSVLDKNDLTSSVGTISLHPVVFGQETVRVDLLKRVVLYYRNNKRGKRYPARTKTISEVSGSGRKLRQQKGMGQARVGHSRPPHFRGGAKAHGPKGVQQDYTTKLNRHTRRLALLHALTQKLLEQNLLVINDWNLESHHTNQLAKLLRRIQVGGKTGTSAYLLDWVDDDDDDDDDAPSFRNLPLHMTVAAGNIPRIKLANQMMANVYDILRHEKLIITLSALEGLEARLQNVAY